MPFEKINKGPGNFEVAVRNAGQSVDVIVKVLQNRIKKHPGKSKVIGDHLRHLMEAACPQIEVLHMAKC